MESKKLTNSELCEAAAEIIEDYGWTQNTMGTPMTGFCLLGAAREAMVAKEGLSRESCQADVHPEFRRAVRAVAPGVDGGKPPDFVSSWLVTDHNDGQLHSGQEAVDVLISAAKFWRDRGE